MRRINTVIIMLLVALQSFAISYHSVNIDKKTAAAMTAAYASEAEMEAMNTSNLLKIVEHYKSATVATAGILLSKKKDRDAMRNPGLFASEENYYYKRILNLVRNGIMPKLITVASRMVKQPENAIYWGPYLLKTTENVEQLCKQFELVCTNGSLSFKDVTFLLISDDLRQLFDLAKLGADTNWSDLLDKLGEFGEGLSKEDLQEDFNNLGSLLASIGKNTADNVMTEGSKIGEVFHMKPDEIADLYDSFKQQFESLSSAGSVKNALMQVIKTSDADGVARLFKSSTYNLSSYISNYLQEDMGSYYTKRWYIEEEKSGEVVYEETFDSQTMNLSNFKERMEAHLQSFRDKDNSSRNNYLLRSDPARYYTMADEKKLEGCNSVSFTASCDGGASLAQGSFNWKENGSQGSSLTEASKGFAMTATPDSQNNNIDELLKKREEYEQQVATLKQQVTTNDGKLKDLIEQQEQAKSLEDQTQYKELRKKYDELNAETEKLKKQLEAVQDALDELNSNISLYYSDLSNKLDGPYRIPANMQELESMYELQWTDGGSWAGYTFVRHGYCPSVKSTVTYTASLNLSQKPKYFLGIRVHRAILSVDFKLSTEYASDDVVAVLKLDMSKSEQERAKEVNDKLKELMEDMPSCTISVKYNYASNSDNDEDEDAIHLLWASDRLEVAREVDTQLTAIYSQLVILDKVMEQREGILDFLKHKILDVAGRASRGTIAEYALTRWEGASLSAMKKQAGVTEKKQSSSN